MTSRASRKRSRRAALRRRKARPYHHGDLKEALVDAASSILARGGSEALTLRATARRAGVSQTAPYRHFADKEALLAAVAATGFRELARHMTQAAEGLHETGAIVEALGLGYVRFARERPHLLRLMFGREIRRKRDHAELEMAAADAYRFIERAMNVHLAPAASIDARLATVSAWALVHGLATLLIDRQIRPAMSGERDDETLIQDVAALFIDGLDALGRR